MRFLHSRHLDVVSHGQGRPAAALTHALVVRFCLRRAAFASFSVAADCSMVHCNPARGRQFRYAEHGNGMSGRCFGCWEVRVGSATQRKALPNHSVGLADRSIRETTYSINVRPLL